MEAQITGASPTNVVANVYHSTPGGDNNRPSALTEVTDGDLRQTTDEGFDTFEAEGNAEGVGDFAGLIYSNPANAAQSPIVFNTATFHVGFQFGDGGQFDAPPSLYILTTNTDPNEADPRTSAAYRLVSGAVITSPVNLSGFDQPKDAGDILDTPITFTLTGLSQADRTGFGFAIVGDGDGALDRNFISVSELSATGIVVPEPTVLGLLALGGLSLLARRRR